MGPAGGGSPSDLPPLMNGTAVPGSSALYSRTDHIHPSDTSRLALTGGTLTGNLTISRTDASLLINKTTAGNSALIAGRSSGGNRWVMSLASPTTHDFTLTPFDDGAVGQPVALAFSRATGLGTVKADPTDALGIATKQMVDGKASAAHTHPASEITDWNEAVDDRVNSLIVAGANITTTYDDVGNTLTIASSGGGGGVSEAPNDGALYGRQSLGWQAGVKKGGDTMTGPLVMPLGSTAATSINFGGANTGFYGIGTTNLGFAVSGVNRMSMSGTTITTTIPFRAQAATVAAPAYSFTLDTNCGIYRSAAGVISMSTLGVESMRWTGSDNSITAIGPLMVSADPTAALQVAPKQYVDLREPALPAGGTTSTFLRGDKTWVVPPGAGGIAEAPTDGQLYSRQGSTATWQVSPGGAGGGIAEAPNDGALYGRQSLGWQKSVKLAGDVMTGALQFATGTAALPSITFAGATGYGMYNAGSSIGFSVGGANRLTLAAVSMTSTMNFLAPNGTAAAPSHSFSATTTMGMYRVAADQIGFSVASGLRLTLAATALTSTVPIVLPADPSTALQAATKQYVDGLAAAAGVPSDATPTMNGTATPGVSTLYARGDHVHPTDTSIAVGDALRVLKTGDTMTGPLVLPANGTAAATSLNYGTAGTGIFGTSAAHSFAVTGVSRLALSATTLTAAVPVSTTHTGTAAATSYNFNTVGTGLYGGATTISAAVSGTSRLTLSATALTLTVPVVLPANPTVALEAATKQYVDARPAIANVSASAPSSPATGQLWWDTDTEELNIWNGTVWKTVVGTWA